MFGCQVATIYKLYIPLLIPCKHLVNRGSKCFIKITGEIPVFILIVIIIIIIYRRKYVKKQERTYTKN